MSKFRIFWTSIIRYDHVIYRFYLPRSANIDSYIIPFGSEMAEPKLTHMRDLTKQDARASTLPSLISNENEASLRVQINKLDLTNKTDTFVLKGDRLSRPKSWTRLSFYDQTLNRLSHFYRFIFAKTLKRMTNKSWRLKIFDAELAAHGPEKAFLALARAYQKDGLNAKATEVLIRAQDWAPDSSKIVAALIKLAIAEKNILIASKYANTAVTKFPDDADVLAASSSVAAFNSEYIDAISLLVRALHLEPSAPNRIARILKLSARAGNYEYTMISISIAKKYLSTKRHRRIAINLADLYGLSNDRDFCVEGIKELFFEYNSEVDVLAACAKASARIGAYELADEILFRQLEIDPNSISAAYNRSGVLCQLSRTVDALNILTAIHSDSNSAALLNARIGHILAWSGLDKEAVSYLKDAIKLEPEMPQPYADLSLCYERTNETSLAFLLLEHAMILFLTWPKSHPTAMGLVEANNARVKRRLMYACIETGQLERASMISREFARTQPINLPFDFTIWESGSFHDKHILVVAESGVGDELRFVSIYGRVFSEAKSVCVTCDPRLLTLLQRSFPGFEFIPTQRFFKSFPKKVAPNEVTLNRHTSNLFSDDAVDAASNSDFVVSSYHVFDMDFINHRKTPQSPAAAVLCPDPQKLGSIRPLLASIASGRALVGISWRGGHTNYRRNHHYYEVEDFSPLYECDQLSFVSLQYSMSDKERLFLKNRLGSRFIDLENIDIMNDFESIAAICKSVDAVVSVCTAVLELSAAVGSPTFYAMRDPVFTHRVRCMGDSDPHGLYQDRVWTNCLIAANYDNDALGVLSRIAKSITERFSNNASPI